MAAYAFDEPVCWPSQSLIASDIGTLGAEHWHSGVRPPRVVTRLMVTRSIARLLEKGWLRTLPRKWSRRTRWTHNVYELLEPWNVSEDVARRIVRRAHLRRYRQTWATWAANAHRTGRYGPLNTNVVEVRDSFGNSTQVKAENLRKCCCRSCREEDTWHKGLARRIWPHGTPPKSDEERKQIARRARYQVSVLLPQASLPDRPDGTYF